MGGPVTVVVRDPQGRVEAFAGHTNELHRRLLCRRSFMDLDHDRWREDAKLAQWSTPFEGETDLPAVVPFCYGLVFVDFPSKRVLHAQSFTDLAGMYPSDIVSVASANVMYTSGGIFTLDGCRIKDSLRGEIVELAEEGYLAKLQLALKEQCLSDEDELCLSMNPPMVEVDLAGVADTPARMIDLQELGMRTRRATAALVQQAFGLALPPGLDAAQPVAIAQTTLVYTGPWSFAAYDPDSGDAMRALRDAMGVELARKDLDGWDAWLRRCERRQTQGQS